MVVTSVNIHPVKVLKQWVNFATKEFLLDTGLL